MSNKFVNINFMNKDDRQTHVRLISLKKEFVLDCLNNLYPSFNSSNMPMLIKKTSSISFLLSNI